MVRNTPVDLDALDNWLEEMVDDPMDGFYANVALEAVVELRASRRIVEAATSLVDHGREWIGGTKYCPECMAEGWHYDGCKSGQEFWDLRKALEDAVRA